MGKIKIIADSTSYIPREYAEKKDIKVIPLSYMFEDQTYNEGYAGEFDEYFTRLKNSDSFPMTSQPSTGEILNAFEEGLEENDKIIAIFLSSELSGTYNNALIARDMLDRKEDIAVIDSRLSVAAMRFLIEEALQLIEEGEDFDYIVKHLNEIKNNVIAHVTTGSLEYLGRGGRLSNLQYKVGNLLNIKPIIELSDGELKLVDKVHGRKKAINNIIDRVNKDVKRIAICHILYREDAKKFKEVLSEQFPNAYITIEDIGPVIGSHLGPESIGICYY